MLVEDSVSVLVPDDGVDDVLEEVPLLVVVLLLLELEPPPAGEGFTTVVLFSVLLPAGEPPGATVSVFCSHAAKSAAPAMMQMYFFIGV